MRISREGREQSVFEKTVTTGVLAPVEKSKAAFTPNAIPVAEVDGFNVKSMEQMRRSEVDLSNGHESKIFISEV